MTLLSDDTSFFGTIVPTVYIKNVTLENSATGLPQHLNTNDRINPHVDAGDTNLDAITTTGEEPFKVTVDFLIKENLGNTFNEITTTWSDETTLQNYTNIQMMLFSNSFIAKIIQYDPALVNNPDGIKIMEAVYYLASENLLTSDEIAQAETIGFTNSSFQQPFSEAIFDLKPGITFAQLVSNYLDLFIDGVVADKALNLGDAMKNGTGIQYGDYPQLTQYAEVDEDGKKVVNYQFTKVLYVPDFYANTNYLSLVVAPYMDIQGLGANFDVDLEFLLGPDNTSTPYGKVKTQNIITNGKVVSNSVVYYLEDDMSVWTGHIHSNNGVLMTGKYFKPDSRKVVAKTVNNSTVQDFRIIDRIAKLKFDLSFLQTDKVSLAEAYKFTRDKTDVLKQPAYFSKNYVSRGIDGSAKFLFGMDLYSFVREQTTFGSLLLPEQANEINMSIARALIGIASLKVKRRRVDVVPQSNRLGTYNAQEIPFKTGYLGEPHIDVEEIVKDVIIAKQAQMQPLQMSFSSLANSTFEAVDFSVPENGDSGKLANVGFQFFTGMDSDVATQTDGHYQYGVELEIIDATPAIITSKITSLITSYRTMMGYYNFCKIPGKQYNVNSGRFRPVLNNYYIAINKEPWLNPIKDLTNVIRDFKDKNENFDAEDFQDQLELICHPATGSPRGVESVLKLILNAATKLAEIAGTTLNFATIAQVASLVNPDGTADANFNKPIDNKIFATAPDKRTIKVEYYFDDSFDTEVPKKYGYDYLTSTGDSATAPFGGLGLATIQGDDFNTRMNLEMQKYFESTSPENFEITNPTNGKTYTPGDTALTSLFSYLTPASVNLGTGQVKSALLGQSLGFTGVDATKFSLLPFNNAMEADKYLFNKRAFSYIATKIINFNNNATLPVYDNTTTSDNTLLSGYENSIKFYTQQILANKNCVSGLSGKSTTDTKNSNDGNGLFMSDFLTNAIDQADGLNDSKIKLDELANDPLSISYKGGAENTLFLTFIYGSSAQNYGIASTKAPASIAEGKQEVTFDFDFFQIGADTPNKPAIEGTILTKKIAGQPSGTPPEGQAPILVQNELKKLPNQIKSILLQYDSETQVKHKWNTQTDPDKNSNNPYYKASIAINYRNIKRVEYLAGFDYSSLPVTNGGTSPVNALIGRPTWKLLTPEIYGDNIGTTLFCRLKTYEDKDYGIVPMESLNMPVFDEFFLLAPAEYESGAIAVSAPAAVIASAPTVGSTVQGKLTGQDPSEYHDDSIYTRPLEKADLDIIKAIAKGAQYYG